MLADTIRDQFPALARTHRGRPLAFLDGPAGSQLPRSVIDAVAGYLALHNANTGGFFPTALETDRMLGDARAALADFVGAADGAEIVFGANMTSLTYALSRALARTWGPGDEVVVTELDHQANVAPWRAAAEDRGATVRVVPFDPESGVLDHDALESCLGPHTRLVAIGHASNAIGTVNDVQRVASAARAVGALSFVDAVHYAPHGTLDVQALSCDFLVCSAYKFFGPHVGVLWGRTEHLDRFTPYRVPPAPDWSPDRWESGTLSHEGIAGTAAAVEWIASLGDGSDRRARIVEGMRRISAHEDRLFARLYEGLGAIDAVRIYGPPAGGSRTPTAGFAVRGRTAEDVARALAEEAVCVWSGDFYASGVVERLGLGPAGGLVRAGLAPYTSAEEVERLLDGVQRLCAGRVARGVVSG